MALFFATLTAHRIPVWHITLHLVDFYGKCRYIYHTWILLVGILQSFFSSIYP